MNIQKDTAIFNIVH